MFSKVLIANRGEIAGRIGKTLRRMGIASVAVYSDADRFTRPVRDADEAVRVGSAPAAESYLDIDAIVAACLQTGAQAVHPGYGFLSENRQFAERLATHGISFIGPRPEHLEAFGLKHKARELAQQSHVPLLPGSGLLETIDEAMAEAHRIGFPLMLKSTAGGGGIGMQLCHDAETLRDRFAAVQRTARASFGFHAAWRLDDNGRQIDSPAGTRFLISTYPEPVRAWIVKNGGLKSRTIYLTGNGLAAMDRQICMEPINRDVVATNYPQPRRSKYASVW